MFLSDFDLQFAFVLFIVRKMLLFVTAPIWFPLAFLLFFAVAVRNSFREEKPDGHNFCQQETN